jgi:hypothetical protein
MKMHYTFKMFTYQSKYILFIVKTKITWSCAGFWKLYEDYILGFVTRQVNFLVF